MTADPDVLGLDDEVGRGLVGAHPPPLPAPPGRGRRPPGRRGVDPGPPDRGPDPTGRRDRAPTCPADSKGWWWPRRRSATSAGTEGFFHYRQYSATDLAARRSLEDVWHLLFDGELPDRAASARLRRRGGRPASHPRRAGRDAPRPGRHGAAARRPAHRRSRSSVPSSAGGPPSTSTTRSCGPRRSASAPSSPPCSPPSTDSSRARSRSRPGTTSPTPPTTCGCCSGRGGPGRPCPGHRAVPDAHHRPRVQRLHLHRPGHRLDRCRPGRGHRRGHRGPVGSAPRRCTEPGPGHARLDRDARPGRGLDPRRRAAG